MTRTEAAILAGLVAASLAFGARLAWSHSWYDMACCSKQDCHPVDVREISEDGPDYIWRGMRFPKSASRPSMDENYHVCSRPAAPFIQPRIICLYRPSPGV